MPVMIYLARHATPDRFRPGFIYHQLPGPPLTLQGIQEAQFLGAYLLSAGVHQVYASPFERCRHTAELAAQTAGISWQVEDCLGELQPGEGSDGILARVLPAFKRICCGSEASGPAAIVTHGGIIAALLLHLGMDSAELEAYKKFDYGNPVPPAGAWLAQQSHQQTAWTLHLAFQPETVPSAA